MAILDDRIMKQAGRGWLAAAGIYVPLVVILSVAAFAGDDLVVYQALVIVTLPIGIPIPIATYLVGATLAEVSGVGLNGATWLTAVFILMYGFAAMGNVILVRALVRAIASVRRPPVHR